MICPNCGHVAKDTDKFCEKCATRLIPIPAAAEAAAEEAVEEVGEQAAAAVDTVEETAAAAVEAVEEKAAEAEADVIRAVEEAPKAPEPPAAPVYEPKPEEKYVYTCGGMQPERIEEPVKAAEEPVCCDRQNKPLNAWGYLWRMALCAIPILGIIPLFVFAFARGINKNSRGWARAILIILLIFVILLVCGAVLLLIFFDKEQITGFIDRVTAAINSI